MVREIRKCPLWMSVAVMLFGCGHRTPRPDTTRPTPVPSVAPALTEAVRTDPVPSRPPVPSAKPTRRVAVILGPGGARALAHAGVLKSFQRQRIPVEKIVGIEWGALVGGLFAHHAQIHDVEWKLYKLEQQNLPRPKGFFGRSSVASVKVMDAFFDQAFGGDDVQAARLKFSCPTRTLSAGVVSWQDRGPWRDTLKKCLPFPPIFNIDGNSLAAASQAPEAIETLRKDGYDLIVLVNVIGAGPAVPDDPVAAVLWQEVRRATLSAGRADGVELVDVNAGAQSVLSFDAARDMMTAGETAGNAAAHRLITKFGF